MINMNNAVKTGNKTAAEVRQPRNTMSLGNSCKVCTRCLHQARAQLKSLASDGQSFPGFLLEFSWTALGTTFIPDPEFWILQPKFVATRLLIVKKGKGAYSC